MKHCLIALGLRILRMRRMEGDESEILFPSSV
jgi:hypothetical protein